jgi:hypothetical protein
MVVVKGASSYSSADGPSGLRGPWRDDLLLGGAPVLVFVSELGSQSSRRPKRVRELGRQTSECFNASDYIQVSID